MAKEKLDVFISSDQKEFSKERIKLAGTICAIPFLTCILLENRGADPTGVLEASLKGVRDSDIYVGIFGHEHSEITVREYEQAVKMRKPCLTYVKKARRKDETLEKFINEELKGQFKYHEFRNVAGLIQQVESDLKRFILETLEVGLEARAQKKTEAVALIRKEQLVSLKETTSTSPLARADAAFKRGNYLESLINTTIALETELRKSVESKKSERRRESSGRLASNGFEC